jgi:hypothetical protein
LCDLIDSADKDGMLLNRIITGDKSLCFSVEFVAEVTVCHLEITTIAKKEETRTR